MLTNNVIDGFFVPTNCLTVQDYPRDMRIPTVDFVYQYIAAITLRIKHVREIILNEVSKHNSWYKKCKKRILNDDTYLGFLFADDDKKRNIQALNILAFFIYGAKEKDAACEKCVELLLRLYENNSLQKYFAVNCAEQFPDVSETVLRAQHRNTGVALKLFHAASKKDNEQFVQLVRSLDEDLPFLEPMIQFVREAVGEKVWNARTLMDIQLEECDIFHMRPTIEELRERIQQGQRSAVPTYNAATANERPRVSMLLSNFRVSEGLGIGSDIMNQFMITKDIRTTVCRIMLMTMNRSPVNMVHNSLTDQRIRDSYISLLYMYGVSKYCVKMFKKNIYLENQFGSAALALQRQEKELTERESAIKQREADLEETQKTPGVDNDEFYQYRANAMKRESALRKKNEELQDRIKLLEGKIEELTSTCDQNPIPSVASMIENVTDIIDDAEDMGNETAIDYHSKLLTLSDSLTIAFCGGNQNYINNLRAQQPHLTYINGKDIASCDQAVRNCDIVLFCTQSLGHSLYGKIKKICQQREIPYKHLKQVTSVPLSEKMIYEAVLASQRTASSEEESIDGCV